MKKSEDKVKDAVFSARLGHIFNKAEPRVPLTGNITSQSFIPEPVHPKENIFTKPLPPIPYPPEDKITSQSKGPEKDPVREIQTVERPSGTYQSVKSAKAALHEFVKIIPCQQWAKTSDTADELLSLTALNDSIQTFIDKGYTLPADHYPLACAVCTHCKTISTNYVWLFVIHLQRSKTSGLDRVLACPQCRRPVIHFSQYITKPFLVNPTELNPIQEASVYLEQGPYPEKARPPQ